MDDDQGTDFEPRARPPGRAEPPKPQRESVAPGRSISVDINPRQLRVTPGVTESATVSIRYHGSLTSELSLRLSGEPATWTRVVPDVVNAYPDTEVEATLRFDPPRTPSLAAGLTEIALEVSSSADSAATTMLRRSIEIAPFDELSAGAAAATNLSDAREAVLPIKVRNLGNRLALLSLRATDPGSLEFQLSSTSVPLQPGEETTVWITIKPRQLISAGAPRVHPFTVYVSSDRTPSVAIDGRFEQVAVPPPTPTPPPPVPAPVVTPPAWRSTPQPKPPKKGGSGLLPALLVLALLAGAGLAAAYVLKLGPFSDGGSGQTATPIGDTPEPTSTDTEAPTETDTEPPAGGPDISGNWAFGEIGGSIRQMFGEPPGFGVEDLNVTGEGIAAWGVHLFDTEMGAVYRINCGGSYDSSSSTLTPTSASPVEGGVDGTSILVGKSICGWDLENGSSSIEAWSVSVSDGQPRRLTLTGNGDTQLTWQEF